MRRDLTTWVVAGLCAVGGWVVVGQARQEPAPAGQQPPAGRGRIDPAGPGGGQGRGAPRGGGGRAGGVIAGGAQADDPAYANIDFSSKNPVLPATPADEATRIWLPNGFTMEPVLTDPDIQEPAQIAFDGNGRMYVLELRGYMQDADATGELDAVGRISVHEDRDNDGVYETHHVFVDKLVFPRFVMPLRRQRHPDQGDRTPTRCGSSPTRTVTAWPTRRSFRHGLGRLRNVEHPGERPHLGDGQLDVQHHQPGPPALDAARACCESRPVRTAPSGA